MRNRVEGLGKVENHGIKLFSSVTVVTVVSNVVMVTKAGKITNVNKVA